MTDEHRGQARGVRSFIFHRSSLIRGSAAFSFDFAGRNRRPPRDPVNALLSLAYSLLAKDLTIVTQTVGFDPYLGYFHQPRFGRASLALDLMEPFRPLIADSAVLSAINTRMVTPDDFVRAGDAVALTADGRKKFFQAYEQRMDTLVTHPLVRLSCQLPAAAGNPDASAGPRADRRNDDLPGVHDAVNVASGQVARNPGDRSQAVSPGSLRISGTKETSQMAVTVDKRRAPLAKYVLRHCAETTCEDELSAAEKSRPH